MPVNPGAAVLTVGGVRMRCRRIRECEFEAPFSRLLRLFS
jgi:hypothetical protein